jgi:hypothetical protein
MMLATALAAVVYAAVILRPFLMAARTSTPARRAVSRGDVSVAAAR